MTKDYVKLYDLEGYLFNVVSPRFAGGHDVSAFDFFCIVIWKANRAKSKIAARLLAKHNYTDLGKAVSDLIRSVRQAGTAEERLRILITDWKLRLPMASAILSVLYPEEFTVYDVRVCDQLGRSCDLQHKARFSSVWDGYNEYLEAVRGAGPSGMTLRDKDRWFWGKSFAEDLENSLDSGFQKVSR